MFTNLFFIDTNRLDNYKGTSPLFGHKMQNNSVKIHRVYTIINTYTILIKYFVDLINTENQYIFILVLHQLYHNLLTTNERN